ncbi:MAG: 30S ribosomal protein S16, partial [Actinomycetota bacterium]
PRDGRFIENIGRYHPRAHPSVIEIDEERALHWLKNGAQPSDPVRVLLRKTGIWASFTGEAPPPAFEPATEGPTTTPEASDPASPTKGVGSAEPSASTDEREGSPEATPLVAEGEPEGSTGDQEAP